MTIPDRVQRCWHGLFPPGQTLIHDRVRQRLTAASRVGHGRTRIIAVLGATPAAGTTTVTALVATVAHALHGSAPTLIDDSPRGDLTLRLPEHYPYTPIRTWSGPDPSEVARTRPQNGGSSLLLADLSLHNARLGLLGRADLVIMTRPPHPSADPAARHLRTWLVGLSNQYGQPGRPVLDIATNTTKRVTSLAVPHDPALTAGPIDARRMNAAVVEAAVAILAAFPTRPA